MPHISQRPLLCVIYPKFNEYGVIYCQSSANRVHNGLDDVNTGETLTWISFPSIPHDMNVALHTLCSMPFTTLFKIKKTADVLVLNWEFPVVSCERWHDDIMLAAQNMAIGQFLLFFYSWTLQQQKKIPFLHRAYFEKSLSTIFQQRKINISSFCVHFRGVTFCNWLS